VRGGRKSGLVSARDESGHCSNSSRILLQ